jgi:hypothetical protein
MLNKDEMPQRIVNEVKKNHGSRHRSSSKAKSKSKEGFPANSGESGGTQHMENGEKLDKNTASITTQGAPRKRNKNQLELESGKLKSSPTKRRKK